MTSKPVQARPEDVSNEEKNPFVNFLETNAKEFWLILESFPIPPWATLTIAGVVLLLLLIGCCFCCRKCCKKCCGGKKDGDDGVLEGEVHFDQIQLIGAPTQEKVQPTTDEMDYSVLGYFDEEELEGTQLGKVKFSMRYDFKDQNLHVTIFEARDLAAADEAGTSDPYIRVMLLPDTKRRFETLVLDKTLRPVYNQEFVFKKVPYSELANRTLCIQALDFDQVASHDLLGEAKLPLIDVNLAKPVDQEWRILAPAYDEETGEFRKSVSDYGDLCVSVHYIPTKKKLLVYLIEAQNLKSVDEGGVSDPFVLITLKQNGKNVKRKKSRVKKQTLNPYYNEQFDFTVTTDKIEDTAVEFLVMDYDLFGGADVIGQVTIGANTYGPQLRQWKDMIKFPLKPVPQWHMLRPKPKPGEED